MSCTYSDKEGKCTLDDGFLERLGCEEGLCICEDDPDPTMLCEDFESKEG